MVARDPLYLIFQGFEQFVNGILPGVKVFAEWPSTETVKVHLPCIAISEVSEKAKHVVSIDETHKIVNENGLLVEYKELLRFNYLIQVSISTGTKAERREIGSVIVQEVEKIKRIPLPDGEHSLFTFSSKYDDMGEPGYYTRHITYEANGRLLISTPYTPVTSVNTGVQP